MKLDLMFTVDTQLEAGHDLKHKFKNAFGWLDEAKVCKMHTKKKTRFPNEIQFYNYLIRWSESISSHKSDNEL